MAFGATFWFTKKPEIPTWVIVFSCIIITLISLKIRYSHPNTFLIASILTYFLTGMTLAVIETILNPTIMLSQPITTTLRGIVKWREPMQDGKWRYLVQILETNHYHSELLSQQVMLSVTKKHAPFPSGNIIEGTARLSPPSGPALPGLFDISFFSYYKGIGAVGYFYSTPRTIPLSDSHNNWKQFLVTPQSFFV
ncbi:hypothetical protein LSO9J_100051 [Candidatus Liberibacter solanacearum]|uniref:DUF4131 domain-containing protein n=1 Tax=Candidatus Liberibacter solanacearum TaxID=556287 RepID=UPI003871FA65